MAVQSPNYPKQPGFFNCSSERQWWNLQIPKMLNFNIWYVKVDVIHPNLHLWIQGSENGWSAWWGGKMIILQESYSTTHPSNTSQVCTHPIQLWKDFFGLQPVGKGCLGCVPVRCVETTLGRIHHHFHDRTLGQQASPQAVARHHVDPKETTPERDVFLLMYKFPNKEWDKEYNPAENEKTSPTDFGKVRKIIDSKVPAGMGIWDSCLQGYTNPERPSVHPSKLFRQLLHGWHILAVGQRAPQ